MTEKWLSPQSASIWRGAKSTAEVENLLWRAGQLVRNDFGAVVSDNG